MQNTESVGAAMAAGSAGRRPTAFHPLATLGTVARIPLPDPDDFDVDPATHQALVDWQDPTSSGVVRVVPNVIRAMANHPGLMRNRGIVYGNEARITPVQRELAYLSASVANHCHY
jgi:hypothetical protein